MFRPKWVAYNFFGLDKINPNGRKWQPWAPQYIKGSLRVAGYVNIWFLRDSFYQLPITFFCLKPELFKKNYYAFRQKFDKNLTKLITFRLRSYFKIKLYYKQNGLCAICNEALSLHELLVRSPKIHMHYILSGKAAERFYLWKSTSYSIFGSKILLHAKCRFVLHMNKFF